MIHANAIHRFVRESNGIEGIKPNFDKEFRIEEHMWAFLALDKMTLDDLLALLHVFEPTAQLRDKEGMDVRVGGRIPPVGGPYIRAELEDMIASLNIEIPGPPFEWHQDFECLHPFTDGNGRTGRAIWLWQMVRQGYDGEPGFLWTWYMQSLKE